MRTSEALVFIWFGSWSRHENDSVCTLNIRLGNTLRICLVGFFVISHTKQKQQSDPYTVIHSPMLTLKHESSDNCRHDTLPQHWYIHIMLWLWLIQIIDIMAHSASLSCWLMNDYLVHENTYYSHIHAL